MDAAYGLITQLNTSKVFAGMSMLLLNLGSRYVVADIKPAQERLISSDISRRIILFCMLFVATRDVLVAAFMAVVLIILSESLLNEKSKLCLLPRYLLGPPGAPSLTEYQRARHVVKAFEGRAPLVMQEAPQLAANRREPFADAAAAAAPGRWAAAVRQEMAPVVRGLETAVAALKQDAQATLQNVTVTLDSQDVLQHLAHMTNEVNDKTAAFYDQLVQMDSDVKGLRRDKLDKLESVKALQDLRNEMLGMAPSLRRELGTSFVERGVLDERLKATADDMSARMAAKQYVDSEFARASALGAHASRLDGRINTVLATANAAKAVAEKAAPASWVTSIYATTSDLAKESANLRTAISDHHSRS